MVYVLSFPPVKRTHAFPEMAKCESLFECTLDLSLMRAGGVRQFRIEGFKARRANSQAIRGYHRSHAEISRLQKKDTSIAPGKTAISFGCFIEGVQSRGSRRHRH